jgi:4a-hydroxytetrahydrobiopterin dehydratase
MRPRVQEWHLSVQDGDDMELAKKKCVPCEGSMSALGPARVADLLSQVPRWQVKPDEGELRKRFQFETFLETMAFVGRMAELAEAEGHHPDFCVRYDVLDVTLTTHAIGGLSENDFILAAKIDQLRQLKDR